MARLSVSNKAIGFCHEGLLEISHLASACGTPPAITYKEDMRNRLADQVAKNIELEVRIDITTACSNYDRMRLSQYIAATMMGNSMRPLHLTAA